jgi:DNA-directed RNA polymerase subunit RPC12/RpoP
LSTELKKCASGPAQFRPVSSSFESPFSQSVANSTRTTPSVADLMATGPSDLFMQQYQQSSSLLASHVTTPVRLSPRSESVQPQASATCESLPPLATPLAQAAVTAQKKLHKCPQCEKTFRLPGYVTAHIKRIHSNEERHLCPQCEKTFGLAEDVKKHIKTVHSNKKRYKCPQCEKTFAAKGIIPRHIKAVHDKIKDNQCPHCPHKTTLEEDMKKHIKVVHDKIKEYQCPHCTRKCGQSSNLNDHIKLKHPETQKAKK